MPEPIIPGNNPDRIAVHTCKRCNDSGKYWLETRGGDEILMECECRKESLASLRAENARLREVLEAYANNCPCCAGTTRVINLSEEEVDCWLCRPARAALNCERSEQVKP